MTGTAAVFAPDGRSFALPGDGSLEVHRVDAPAKRLAKHLLQ